MMPGFCASSSSRNSSLFVPERNPPSLSGGSAKNRELGTSRGHSPGNQPLCGAEESNARDDVLQPQGCRQGWGSPLGNSPEHRWLHRWLCAKLKPEIIWPSPPALTMKPSLPLLIVLPALLGMILAPMTAQAEHPVVEAAREMQAELERQGFASKEALVQDFLKWRRRQRQNRDTAFLDNDHAEPLGAGVLYQG